MQPSNATARAFKLDSLGQVFVLHLNNVLTNFIIVFMPSVHEIEGAFKKFGPCKTSIASKPKGHTVITKELEDRSLYHH